MGSKARYEQFLENEIEVHTKTWNESDEEYDKGFEIGYLTALKYALKKHKEH